MLSARADLGEAFTRYAARRYERCELVVEPSARIGEREVAPAAYPDFDHSGRTQNILATMVRPA